VRILGEVTQAAADTLREADHIFIEELRKAGWYRSAGLVPGDGLGVADPRECRAEGLQGGFELARRSAWRLTAKFSGRPPALQHAGAQQQVERSQ
jgi:hypothetical protein